MRRWARLVGVAVAAVLMAGCPSGRSDPPSDPTLPTNPATTLAATTSTTATAGFEVPAVIDVAYAQRVLTELYRLDGELARHVDRTRALDAEFTERAEAIYGGDRLKAERDEYAKDAAIQFRTRASPPGDPIVLAKQVVDSSPTCIVVEGELDLTPHYRNPTPVDRATVFHLVPFTLERFNPTGWGLLVAGVPDPSKNIEVCE